MAGLAAARGGAVIMMDADLQHPPQLLPQLVRKWREGFQIVHAVRRDPPNLSWFKRTTSRLYYRLFAFMSGVTIEPGSADFCLLDRQVVDEVLKFEEEGLFLRGVGSLGRLCDGERAVRVRQRVMPGRASTT